METYSVGQSWAQESAFQLVQELLQDRGGGRGEPPGSLQAEPGLCPELRQADVIDDTHMACPLKPVEHQMCGCKPEETQLFLAIVINTLAGMKENPYCPMQDEVYCKPVLPHLVPLPHILSGFFLVLGFEPFSMMGFFEIASHETICLGWLRTMILLIFAS
jgi:hypothetical protein